jgi:ketosteroid isomerase-like protein
VFAVLITGPPGAGKTSVLTALMDALSDDDVAHAAIEVELLACAHPALTREQAMRHVATLCALYREAGHSLLLVTQTLETDADLALLRAAVGESDDFLVRLEAAPTTPAQSRPVSVFALSGVDLVLSTEGERAEAVAARIRAACPDALAPPSSPAVAFVRRGWAAFARGDVGAVAEILDPLVRWYPAEEPDAEGACHDRGEALAFISRAVADGVSADLLDVRDAGARVLLILHRHTPPDSDERPAPHAELVTVRDGAITEMVIYWTVEEALAAAGLAG